MEHESEVIQTSYYDPEAFGRLYDEYYQPVFGFLYSRTSHAETAKDLTSETFFQALKNLHKYKPRPGASFKSWLFSIAVAQVGNYYRRRSKYLEVTTEEAPEILERDEFRPDIAFQMGEDEQELKEKILLLRELMKKLPEKQQTILTLRYFSHMTIPEVSGVLRMKEGTVKSHLHRALKRLQILMIESDIKLFPNYQEQKSYERSVVTTT
ncbi:MAG: sigma-70 family RNA polymerase sigma factor [Patescibacteria group bacterium]